MQELRLLALSLVAGTTLMAIEEARPQSTGPSMTRTPPAQSHPYVGIWVTNDGHIRHQLLPDGRYDESRGSRKSAYRGRYEVRGKHIDYWDDTGFAADGEFVDENTLHHGGMVFRRAP